MKTLFLSICFILLLITCGQDKEAVEEAVAFQNKLNEEFSDKEASPLTEEGLASFTKLDFFPIDTDYRVSAKLVFHKDSKPFKMPTTSDRLPVYRLYATASFNLKGKACQLEIYQNEKLTLSPEYEDYLFLPFTDNTNGETSYGGGRYIDLRIPEGEEVIIDFNQAYNPYCAYNKKYSCPIPTKVNHLDMDIKAGVMAYKH